MIKICHIVDELRIGGLEKTLKNIVLGLDRNKYQQQVWCLKRKGILARDIEKEGILVREWGLEGGLSVRGLFRLKKELDKENFQIIHAHGMFPYIWAGSVAVFVKASLMVMHCQNLYGNIMLRDKLKLKFLGLFTVKIIAVSQAVKDSLVSEIGVDPGQISVIYNSSDEIKISDPAQKQRLRQELGIEEEDFVVGNISRLEGHKGHRYLIEAVSQLRSSLPHLKCLIVGEGGARGDLERMVNSLDLKERVIFTGLREDVGNLLSLMGVFIQPSTLIEGLPVALTEAASAGIPLIATDIGGNREIVFDGLNGFMVPAQDTGALAQKLQYLFEHPLEKEKMAQESHKIWEEKFSLKKMLENIDSLYEKYITDKGIGI